MSKYFLLIFPLFLAATISTAEEPSIEKIKNANFDEAEITDVRHICAGEKIGGTKASTDMLLIAARAHPPSKVKIALALPVADKWNGIFLGKGNGGMGDRVSVEMAVSGANIGYATAHCDLGTEKWWEDADNLDVVLADFGHDAVYMMTKLGKKAAQIFYGKPPKYSYYLGGSTGGQEGLSMAERHPAEYDGIALLFPVSDRTSLHIRFMFEKALLFPGGHFTDEQISKISEEIVKQNRNNEGEPENSSKPYLKYPERAKVDYSKFDFLSKNQIDLLSGIHSPFLDPATGAFITFGLPPSCEIADNGKSLKNGFDDWMSAWFFRRANIDPSKVDLHKYAIEFKKRFSQDTDAAPNLGKFRKYGKKLLIIQGKIDTIVPAEYIKDWYKLLCKNTGSTEKTLEYARVFLVPGGWHGNMSGVDMLQAIRDWVEKNSEPNRIKVNVAVKGVNYPEDAQLYIPR